MDNFFKFLNSVSPLTPNSEKELRGIMSIKNYVAKTKIWKAGIIPKEIGFLKHGVVRAYTLSPKGKEYNKSLFTTNNFVAAHYGLLKKKPSIYTVESLTDCTIIQCKYEDLLQLVKTHNDIGKLHRKNLEQFYLYISCRNIDFLTLNATERYFKLKQKIPTINNLISQKQIANHLAITPIQLSRIKKKLLKL